VLPLVVLLTEHATAQGVCAATHCLKESVACGLADKSGQCARALECSLKCNSKPKPVQPGCDYLCEMTYGEQDTRFSDLLQCMLNNECLPKYAPDGTCLANDADAVQNLTSMDQLEGDWWVLKGVNCGQLGNGTQSLAQGRPNPTPTIPSGYPGGYDWYPCQHERFVKSNGHDFPNPTSSWVNNITYCGGGNGGLKECSTSIIDTVANVSLTSPGVIHHLYTDAPLKPQDEKWKVVSWPHPDFMLTIWCGHTPVVPYNGGILLSRAGRTVDSIPGYVHEIFRAVAKRFHIVYDEMCPSTNEACP